MGSGQREGGEAVLWKPPPPAQVTPLCSRDLLGADVHPLPLDGGFVSRPAQVTHPFGLSSSGIWPLPVSRGKNLKLLLQGRIVICRSYSFAPNPLETVRCRLWGPARHPPQVWGLPRRMAESGTRRSASWAQGHPCRTRQVSPNDLAKQTHRGQNP